MLFELRVHTSWSYLNSNCSDAKATWIQEMWLNVHVTWEHVSEWCEKTVSAIQSNESHGNR